MLEAHSLAKAFGNVRAVRDVSISVAAGRVVGLLGPNGAGKSTTIRMLVGLLWPDSGSVTLAGHDIVTHPERARAALGYLPESGAIYPEMTPESYLRYRCSLFGIKRPRAAIDRAVEICRLSDVRTRRIANLSKGFTQRTALAGALVHNPDVLILDEPTNGLDVAQLREARTVLRELAQHKTMLVSSHMLTEIERLADDVVIVAGGRVAASGTPAELRSRAGATQVLVKAQAEADVLSALLPPGLSKPIITPASDGHQSCRATLPPDHNADRLLAQIGAAALSHGIALRKLTIELPSLEDAFVGLTGQEDAA